MIRKTAPIVGAGRRCGVVLTDGERQWRRDISAQPVSQIIRSDEAEVTLARLVQRRLLLQSSAHPWVLG